MVVWQAWGIDEPIGPQNPYPDTPPSLRGTVHPRRGRADRVQQEHRRQAARFRWSRLRRLSGQGASHPAVQARPDG